MPISPADGAEFDVFPRDTLLLWKAVDGARSYGVEVDFCDGRVRDKCSNPQPLIQTVVAKGLRPSYAFTFLGSQPGRWRVWAVDMAGHEGFKSEWRSFFYLR